MATEAFWLKIAIAAPDECWPWMGLRTAHQYGTVGVHKENGVQAQVPAHRVAYWMVNGDYDMKLSVLHKCDNPACCNPRHLFLGGPKENIQDCVTKGRSPVAKLKPAQVREIRALLAQGVTREAVAKQFSASVRMIRYISTGFTWGFLNDSSHTQTHKT